MRRERRSACGSDLPVAIPQALKRSLPPLLIGLAAACTNIALDSTQSGPVCRYPGVTFDARFPAGRLNGCKRTGDDSYLLSVRPEDQPINPSPWYAFDVTTQSGRTLELTLDYGEWHHRYSPKLRTADGWEPVPGGVDLDADESRATVSLAVPAGRTRLAAQPVITPGDTADWARSLATSTSLKVTTLGRSAQGRPVIALVSTGEQPETVVITGRQHPPEITGALALRHFVARLTSDDALARRFLERFGLLIVPMLNPDGVTLGHWRHDTAGVDLNRDWGPFRRPETRVVRDALNGLVTAGAPPGLLVDFHSTRRDVLYTQPDDAPGRRAQLPGSWHQAINVRLDGPDIHRSDDHNPDRPTLKTWSHQTFQVPGITFEIGDETAEARIHELAVIAAEELMMLLLDDSG